MRGGLGGELANRLLKALESGDVLEVVAEANSFLEERRLGRVIIVGGYAVELYTGSAYRTGDADLLVEGGADLLRRALSLIEEWRGRAWVSRGLKYAIGIVSTSYDRPKPLPILEVGEERVYIEPPEESVVSCLNACVYWGSDLDCEKAAMIMTAQWSVIDWEYLEKRCREEGVHEKFLEIKRVVEEVRSGEPALQPGSRPA